MALLTKVLGQLCAEETTGRIRSHWDGSRRRGEYVRWRPEAIRAAFERLGPLYIKVGQILSTRPDLVSEPLMLELGKLHDRVTATPFTDFEPVLEQELGTRWRRRFHRIDTDRPLGAASLAQVYRATLDDGSLAAVKIQRPGIRRIIHEDMRILSRGAHMLGKGAPRFNAVFDAEAILGVVFDAMRPELDFVAEAANMENARAAVAQFATLSVPEVVWATERVLVQRLAPGRSIREAVWSDFAEGERMDIGRDLMALMYRGYFVDRSFHADPHPGNIFVQPGGPASLIDWGMVGQIDRRMSIALMLMLLNVVRNDGPGSSSAWIEMGRLTPYSDISGFAADMAALVPRVYQASLQDLNFGTVLGRVLSRSSKRGIAATPMVAVVAKSFANMEGSVRYLAPELSVTGIFEDELVDIMIDLVRDLLSEGQAAASALELMYGSVIGPEQARRTLRDLSNRDLTVRIASVEEPRTAMSPSGSPFMLAGGALLGWGVAKHLPKLWHRACERSSE